MSRQFRHQDEAPNFQRVHEGMKKYRKMENSRLFNNSSIQDSTVAGVDTFSFEDKNKPTITESKLGKREKPELEKQIDEENSELSKKEPIFGDQQNKRQKISVDFDIQEYFDSKKLQESMS